jgi:hypothetical protein
MIELKLKNSESAYQNYQNVQFCFLKYHSDLKFVILGLVLNV